MSGITTSSTSLAPSCEVESISSVFCVQRHPHTPKRHGPSTQAGKKTLRVLYQHLLNPPVLSRPPPPLPSRVAVRLYHCIIVVDVTQHRGVASLLRSGHAATRGVCFTSLCSAVACVVSRIPGNGAAASSRYAPALFVLLVWFRLCFYLEMRPVWVRCRCRVRVRRPISPGTMIRALCMYWSPKA